MTYLLTYLAGFFTPICIIAYIIAKNNSRFEKFADKWEMEDKVNVSVEETNLN